MKFNFRRFLSFMMRPRTGMEGAHRRDPPASAARQGPEDPFDAKGRPNEILAFQSPTVALVNLPMPPAARYIIWIVGSMASTMLVAMAVLPVNRVVSVQGRLITRRPVLLVQSLDGGIVSEIRARVGDFVKKNQVLGVLDPTITQADLKNILLQSKVQTAQVQRLQKEAASEPYRPDLGDPVQVRQGEEFLRRRRDYLAHVKGLDSKIRSQEAALAGGRAAVAMYGAKLRVTASVLKMRSREQRAQVGSKLSTLGAQNAVMDVERLLIDQQKAVNAQEASLDAIKADREAYIQGYKATILKELTAAERKLSELQGEYAKDALMARKITLRAPEDAIVLSEGQISTGAVLAPGGKFMSLVPIAGGLEVEAALPAQNAGYVKQGTGGIIKFATFPYDQYGGALGHVESVSADSFLPPEAAGNNLRAVPDPGSGGLPVFFRVRIAVDRYTLHGAPKFFRPAAGQTVTVDMAVGRRTLLRYFFNRVIPVATEGMRDP